MSTHSTYGFGPTFAEMADPTLVDPALREASASPDLFDLHWKPAGRVSALRLPRALTGVEAPILVLSGRHFPTGSHKVGPAYACLVERQLSDGMQRGLDHAIWPSTGNYGIGGAWVGRQLGHPSVVVLPEQMSQERFDMLAALGARVVRTPGCESSVKEVFDKARELSRLPNHHLLEQFSAFGNYRFHFEVTGRAAMEAVQEAGFDRAAAFVSAVGSGGTIAAGDRLKQAYGSAIVALEPLQCPTLSDLGFGDHRIEGIGDKHVTWIHNVWNLDYVLAIDDQACLEGLELLQDGVAHLSALGVPDAAALTDVFGVSGVCNVLGAIRTARLLGLGPRDPVVTVATDGFDRYPSVLRKLRGEGAALSRDEALTRLERLFHGARPEAVVEGTPAVRRRWHNQKYFTWVEQQGRSVEELRAQASSEFWRAEQEKVRAIDREILARRPAPESLRQRLSS